MRLCKDVPAYACIGLLWFGSLAAVLPARAQQATGSGLEAPSSTQPVAGGQRASLNGLPDSPGASLAGLQEAETQRSNFERQSKPQAAAEAQTAQPQEPEQSQTSPPPPKPVGTAAAGPLKVSGVAASQPAGIAIAPAKQRRVRTIVLRVGAIVGAGVAVGTVVALTQATSSKPPGAR